MFIMKTDLLVSLLCVTLCVSAAAVVPVEDILQKEKADVSVPAAAVADVEEEEAELPASEGEDVQEEKTELSVTEDTADVAPKDLLKDNTLQNGIPPPPFMQERASSHCPQGWQPYHNSCYLLVNLTYTWTNAEFLCESLGASLALAHNLWEYNFLKQMTWKAGFLAAWLGGYRFQGYWKWDDGTPFNYNNWYKHTSSSSYDCIYLNSQAVLQVCVHKEQDSLLFITASLT
ncbi:regenerating islet-derived protein 4-like [Dicentrarchus labrax]|nr:regenerating islet-derived protein 4-like [Dicentrarchus labrax]